VKTLLEVVLLFNSLVLLSVGQLDVLGHEAEDFRVGDELTDEDGLDEGGMLLHVLLHRRSQLRLLHYYFNI